MRKLKLQIIVKCPAPYDGRLQTSITLNQCKKCVYFKGITNDFVLCAFPVKNPKKQTKNRGFPPPFVEMREEAFPCPTNLSHFYPMRG